MVLPVSRVCVAHNFYRQAGGEDAVFENEATLLARAGVEITRFTRSNDSFHGVSIGRTAISTFWNGASRRDLRSVLERSRAQILHTHNTFPLLSPAAYAAAADVGVPVVQTLHNYRLLCPGGLLYRDGHVCTECVGARFAWRGVAHGCYRHSRIATGLTAASTAIHSLVGTWSNAVTRFVALTDFARDLFVAGGLPKDRVVVKPNFLADDVGAGDHTGGYALFVGRLSEEKGVDTLVEAWRRLGSSIPLRVIGSGPLMPGAGDQGAGIQWLGGRDNTYAREMMRDARVLVFPSRWYEGLPMVLLEAFSAGLPVIVSDSPGLATTVTDGIDGRHFRMGDAADLGEKVQELWDSPRELLRLSEGARRTYETRYTAAIGLEQLLDLYAGAIDSPRGRPSGLHSPPTAAPAITDVVQ